MIIHLDEFGSSLLRWYNRKNRYMIATRSPICQYIRLRHFHENIYPWAKNECCCLCTVTTHKHTYGLQNSLEIINGCRWAMVECQLLKADGCWPTVDGWLSTIDGYRNWPRYGLRWSGWYCHQAQHELCRPSRGRLRPRRPAQRVLCLMAVPPTTAQTV